MHEDTKPILLITLYLLILVVPFSNKAYHIDDVAYLYIADQIITDPLRPYSFIVEWGNSAKSAIMLNNPPLIPYYIAFSSLFFARSEMVLHLLYIVFSIAAGISFYLIAKRFIKFPLIASLLMVSTPTFLVNSNNLMFDVPIMAFFLPSMLLFMYGVDNSSHKHLFAGSIIAGLGYLAKPTGAVVVPLLALYCFIQKKPKYTFYQLIPLAFIALFAVHNYLFDDRIMLLNYSSVLLENKSRLEIRLAYIFSNLSYVGGATIFPLFLLYPFILKKRNLSLLAFCALVATIISTLLYKMSSVFISGQYSALEISLFFLLITISMFFVLLAANENFKNMKCGILDLLKIKKCNYDQNSFFVFAWFLGMLIFNSAVVGGSVRWNTLLLPPLLLTYFLILEKLQYSSFINAKILVCALILTAVTGVAIAYADYDYAGSYRHFAENVPDLYKTEGNAVHFTGGAGFQYYMGKKGYRMLSENDNSPKKGDIIIKARESFPRKIPSKLEARIELINTVAYDGKIPIRTQNSESHAGFYTYAGGFLPYSFSNSKLENFEIYYVKG